MSARQGNVEVESLEEGGGGGKGGKGGKDKEKDKGKDKDKYDEKVRTYSKTNIHSFCQNKSVLLVKKSL